MFYYDAQKDLIPKHEVGGLEIWKDSCGVHVPLTSYQTLIYSLN